MRRAVANTMGNITTKPASKKMGKPKIKDATPKANGARFSPNVRIKASARDCAPPEVSTKRPSMAPKPTNNATLPKVLPKFLTNTSFTMLPIGKPVANAVTRLVMIKANKACIRNLIINNRINKIAPAAILNNAPAPIVCVQLSIV